jgi:hypothetical protein
MVTVRSWSSGRLGLIFTVSSVAREDMQSVLFASSSRINRKKPQQEQLVDRHHYHRLSPGGGSSAPRAVLRGPGLPRQLPGRRDTLDAEVHFYYFGGTFSEIVPRQEVPNDSLSSGTRSASAQPRRKEMATARSWSTRRLGLTVAVSSVAREDTQSVCLVSSSRKIHRNP